MLPHILSGKITVGATASIEGGVVCEGRFVDKQKTYSWGKCTVADYVFRFYAQHFILPGSYISILYNIHHRQNLDKYCYVPGKHPWALAAQSPRIGGGQLPRGCAYIVQLSPCKHPPQI